jgi:hypothetical protein
LIDPRLTLIEQALTRKADAVQREFGAMGDALQVIGRKLVAAPRGDTGPLRQEQAALRERQLALAAEINVWRDRARAALRQRDEAGLQAFLAELETCGDETVQAAATAARLGTAETLGSAPAPGTGAGTPAGRLLQRARSETALRAEDPAARQREAVELANRPGLAQDDAVLAELEAGLSDPDPAAGDQAALALIQLHRFRALRLGELEPAHASVRWLARFKHRAAIPVLIEILENPRTGYVPGAAGPVEATNQRSRLVALAALAEWRTAAAQAAIRGRRHDREPQMAEAAERALTIFPGDWQ